MKKAIVVGCMDNTKDHTFESANRVYAVGGVVPRSRLVVVETYNPKH